MLEEDRKQAQVSDSAPTHLRPFVMLTSPAEKERRQRFADHQAVVNRQAADEKEAAEFTRALRAEEKAIANEQRVKLQVQKRQRAATEAAMKGKVKDDTMNNWGSYRVRWSQEVDCGSPWQECTNYKLWWCRVC